VGGPVLFHSAWRLRGSNHEIEPPKASVARLLHVEEEGLVKELVVRVSRFAGKVELGGDDTPTRALDLEMEVAGAAGIKRRDDRVEPPAPCASVN